MNQLRNFVILGAPGGGKGTIAGKLIKDYTLKHVSWAIYHNICELIMSCCR
jgi:adenylate kinase family enzyme